mmetsp:Transcript_24083/g.37163  ORF Transcript_24083/g.37163 Transcript_24083/m.37163 type:complete len:530 (+) Transcript_24083:151-1740(+)|eukprot:CAMPEP_0196817274 /NCGR_PEP_ID=MMETSP1362-20130617/59747_1 /TAXON_ID=163516 /ORGANISM="Leptocylindrus danicus, Strain CCMP1856" /LENGTH=529 /DNA_ID=CAMNT_0042194903 /DNA_START=26 /DNA_END=1615 /DNA_ORIENTATION=+
MESLSSLIITAATGAATALQAAHSAGEARANTRHAFESTQSIIKILVDTIWNAMMACTILFVLFSTSLLSYMVIYLLCMPSRLANEPLYFDYSCRPSFAEQCLAASDSASPSTTVCHPTARAHFLSDHTQWDPIVTEVAPKKFKSRLLKPRKRYYVDTVLVLPESVTNRDMGVFMVQMDLFDDNGVLLAQSSRPAMLPFEGYIVGTLRKILLLPPLLIGAVPEARRLVISNFNNFVENADHCMAGAEVRIVVPKQSRFPDTPLSIQVLRAEVHIGKELNFIQRTMKEWFYTCLFLGTFIVFLFESSLLYLAYLRYYDFQDRIRREDAARNQRNFQGDPPDLADIFAQSFRNFNRRNEDNDDIGPENGQEDGNDMTDNESGNFDDNDSDNWTNNIDNTNGETDGVVDDAEGDDTNNRGDVNNGKQNDNDSLEDPDKWEGYHPQPDQSENDVNDKSPANDENSEAKRAKSPLRKVKKKLRARKGGDREKQYSKSEKTSRSTGDGILVDKIMRGSFEKYVIFTDRDDPEMIS